MKTTGRRVAVTGLGLITPCGTGVEKSWAAILGGRSGVRAITRFDASRCDSRIAGEVPDFTLEDFIDRKESRRMDRFQHFAVAAAEMAWKDSGYQITPHNADRVATIVGSGMGGLASLEETHRKALEQGPSRVSPFFMLQMLSNLAPGYISMRFGAKGPNWATSSACSSGAHAIGEAMRGIQRGQFDAAFAGGTEAPITLMGIAGFAAMKALSRRNEEPARASRPFDSGRDGFVLAEGAGVLFLEELESAQSRGARVYAELIGYGASADAYHVTTPAPRHQGAQRCMRAALQDAGIRPSEVGYLNAHGTSTPAGDSLEAEGIEDVFGEHIQQMPVSSTKSMTGHMNGAAGSAEAVISILAMTRGIVPPTINLEHQDPSVHLDCVPNRARNHLASTVMSNSFGFGGTNVSLIFRSVSPFSNQVKGPSTP